MYKLCILATEPDTPFVVDVQTKAAAVTMRDHYRKAHIDADVVVDPGQHEGSDPDGLQPGDIVP